MSIEKYVVTDNGGSRYINNILPITVRINTNSNKVNSSYQFISYDDIDEDIEPMTDDEDDEEDSFWWWCLENDRLDLFNAMMAVNGAENEDECNDWYYDGDDVKHEKHLRVRKK